MKTYSPNERAEAKKKLPKPVSDFLDSKAIADIYVGLTKKHKLNLRQGELMSETANVTLLGLEPESAIETNLHQALPELSADTMRELVADINDRIFKEARRRLQENVLEPEPEWDEAELGPKPKEGEVPGGILSDEELDKLAEKEEKEGWKPPEEEEELPAPIASRPVIERSEPVKEQVGPSIVLQKLTAPSAANAQVVNVTPRETGIQQISAQPKVPPVSQPNPAPTEPRIYPGGNDPYREIPE